MHLARKGYLQNVQQRQENPLKGPNKYIDGISVREFVVIIS